MSATPTLIVPRRNFLIRALGFTAAGASVAVPVTTLASPEERFRHHVEGVAAAMRELYPHRACDVTIAGNAIYDVQDRSTDGPFVAIGAPYLRT